MLKRMSEHALDVAPGRHHGDAGQRHDGARPLQRPRRRPVRHQRPDQDEHRQHALDDAHVDRRRVVGGDVEEAIEGGEPEGAHGEQESKARLEVRPIADQGLPVERQQQRHHKEPAQRHDHHGRHFAHDQLGERGVRAKTDRREGEEQVRPRRGGTRATVSLGGGQVGAASCRWVAELEDHRPATIHHVAPPPRMGRPPPVGRASWSAKAVAGRNQPRRHTLNDPLRKARDFV